MAGVQRFIAKIIMNAIYVLIPKVRPTMTFLLGVLDDEKRGKVLCNLCFHIFVYAL
jgi:hypothetical protein